MTGRERLFAAIRGERTDSLPFIPISMMVAAEEIGEPYGRYVFDAATHVRGQVAFAGAYDVDHVSAISCPTSEAADLGASIISYEDQPPAVDEENALLADKGRLASLRVVDPGSGRRMSKRLAVIEGLRREMGALKAVEGWVEGPIAESCDLRGINRVMTDFYDDPGFLRELLSFVFENAMGFARAQVRAGADVMGVGDAAASLVGPELYREFVWPWEKEYVEALRAMGVAVRLHVCGDVRAILPLLGELRADILDLDSMVPVGMARASTGGRQLLAGNIDPVRVVKDGTPEIVTRELGKCLEESAGGPYAVNAGCEVPRRTPRENLHAMRAFARIRRTPFTVP
jgi:MtaA/CmuA family methyltransferase